MSWVFFAFLDRKLSPKNKRVMVKLTGLYENTILSCKKELIPILGFLELLFSLDQHVGVCKSKNGAWWDVYFLMLIFYTLAGKIIRFAKFWLPIQNLNSVAVSEIPYPNEKYNFVRFSRKICPNVWTSKICAHLNKNFLDLHRGLVNTNGTSVAS